MIVTLKDYLMGREEIYPEELTEEVKANAAVVVEKVNSLLAVFEAEKLPLETKAGSIITSGWRPPQINSQVKNAAPKSKHMTGQACDIYDPEGVLDEWCLDHPNSLAALGLWQEHPSATKGWLHVQTISPRSGNRTFYP